MAPLKDMSYYSHYFLRGSFPIFLQMRTSKSLIDLFLHAENSSRSDGIKLMCHYASEEDKLTIWRQGFPSESLRVLYMRRMSVSCWVQCCTKKAIKASLPYFHGGGVQNIAAVGNDQCRFRDELFLLHGFRIVRHVHYIHGARSTGTNHTWFGRC